MSGSGTESCERRTFGAELGQAKGAWSLSNHRPLLIARSTQPRDILPAGGVGQYRPQPIVLALGRRAPAARRQLTPPLAVLTLFSLSFPLHSRLTRAATFAQATAKDGAPCASLSRPSPFDFSDHFASRLASSFAYFGQSLLISSTFDLPTADRGGSRLGLLYEEQLEVQRSFVQARGKGCAGRRERFGMD